MCDNCCCLCELKWHQRIFQIVYKFTDFKYFFAFTRQFKRVKHSSEFCLTKAKMDHLVDMPTIPEVFNGKKVLITGATGFVGKVLLEKLLRSCPGISEIIILVRGHTEAERLEKCRKLVQYKVFDRIREECPDAFNKVRCIHGEIAWKNMGIAPAHLEKLCEEVSFVFHCAANVRFDCDPRLTLRDNLKGVNKLLKLCKRMPNLEAVVHVSTAFSFCNQPVIGEEIYTERTGPLPVLDALKWMTPDQLKHFAAYLTEGRPSLYHASKALAEILISEVKDDLPIIIVRPSIVTASMSEPFPGWIDNYNGPSGFIALSSKGILKTLLVKDKVNADWVPVDVVANTLIVAAHSIAVKRKAGCSPAIHAPKVPIVNCVFPEANQITWTRIVDITIPILFKYPSATVITMPGGVVTSSQTLNTMCKYLLHYLPAFLLDSFLILKWRDNGMVNTYTKIHSVLNHLQLYTTHQFLFTSKNMQRLNAEMSLADRRVFPIDLSQLNWPLYMQNYVLGVRRYFLKEKDDSLPAARRRVTMLTMFHYCSIVVLSGGALYFLGNRLSTKLSLLSAFEAKNALAELFRSSRNYLPVFNLHK
ncbi:hypothetical protein JTE90_017275 [Oedothorax gibbosus]|uniref:Fatty acyl-CoA reductase n=1 Tax=Oedothorax gibbosus TaxID=931172 RepID=A0AAV6VDR3_9ARAC|nr:hypothetical protein JTE90_017275 [Oedothorax gibbosus]